MTNHRDPGRTRARILEAATGEFARYGLGGGGGRPPPRPAPAAKTGGGCKNGGV
jgi:hypothetical protein